MINNHTEYQSVYSRKTLQFMLSVLRRIKSFQFKINDLQPQHRIIIDCGIAFISVILSTVMRMGLGIFEYSLLSLFLNSVVFSLVAGAVFLKLEIDKCAWSEFSTFQIKQLLLGVIITNLLSYSMMLWMDRHGCLSSSIMFINTFVLSGLLLVPRLLSKHRVVNQASDIIIGSPNFVLRGLTKVIAVNDFKPIGVVIAGTGDNKNNLDTDFSDESIPVLGELADIASILHSLQSRKVTPKRIVIINPVASDEFELLKEYTSQNGIIMLQVFTSVRTEAKVAD